MIKPLVISSDTTNTISISSIGKYTGSDVRHRKSRFLHPVHFPFLVFRISWCFNAVWDLKMSSQPSSSIIITTVRSCQAVFSPVYMLWFNVRRRIIYSLNPLHFRSVHIDEGLAGGQRFPVVWSDVDVLVETYVVERGPSRLNMRDMSCFFHIITRFYILSFMIYVWRALVCLH